MKIGIDIDDTIANTSETLWSHEEEYLACQKTGYFDTLFQKIGVKPDCKKVLKHLKEKGFEIILITARSENCFKDPEKLTKKYLSKYKIPYDKLIIAATDKKSICREEHIDIFIDDNIDICQTVKQLDINVFLMDSSLNQEKNELKRVMNWKEVEELLKKEEVYGKSSFNK